MFKYFKSLMSNEEGYGTVELLLIVAGIGLLATALFTSLTNSLVGNVEDGGVDKDSTTGKVVDGVNTLIDGWFKGDPINPTN